MAAAARVLDDSSTPSVLVPTPVSADQLTYSADRSRHAMRYVTYVSRTPIMRDFITKLCAATASGKL